MMKASRDFDFMIEIAIKHIDIHDAEIVKNIHSASVKALEGNYYDSLQINAWTSGGVSGMENAIRKSAGGFVARFEGKDTPACGYGLLNADGNSIWQLYVLPSCWGQGVGKKLLESMENVIFKNSHSLELLSNRFSKGFYEKMGYSILYEDKISISGIGIEVFKMKKNRFQGEC